MPPLMMRTTQLVDTDLRCPSAARDAALTDRLDDQLVGRTDISACLQPPKMHGTETASPADAITTFNRAKAIVGRCAGVCERLSGSQPAAVVHRTETTSSPSNTSQTRASIHGTRGWWLTCPRLARTSLGGL